MLRIQKTVIGEEGSYVNIEIIYVNADGRLDILTSVTGIRGQPGKVNISKATYELVKNDFHCISRGKIEVKNKGEVDMFFAEPLRELV